MDRLSLLVKEISGSLRACGFRKQRTSFYLEKDNNLGLIDFQKHKQAPENFSFTINLGVFSTYLWNLTGYEIKGRPDISMCQWHQRIGFLLPQNCDHWWPLDDSAPSGEEIKKILLELAVPAIMSHVTDDGLMAAWLNKESGGLGDYMRLMHLTSLLKLKNSDKLQEVAKELRSIAKGKTMENSINEHLLELGVFDH